MNAIVLVSYDPARHNVFSSGDFSDPEGTTFVRNTGSGYLGAGYDFSGVGWERGSGMGGLHPMHNITLISPLHGIQAEHNESQIGSTYYFVGADNELTSNRIARMQTTKVATPGYEYRDSIGDTSIGTFDRTFRSDEQLNVYRILDVRDRIPNSNGDATNDHLLFLYGSQSSSNSGPIIGESRTWTWTQNAWTGSIQPRFLESSNRDNTRYWTLGDSGSPAFIERTEPDGSKSLHIAGTAFTSGSYGSLYTGFAEEGEVTLGGQTYAYDPGKDINALLREDGYALKYTIFNDPTNVEDTAARWTGSAGVHLFSSGNWSTSASPHTESVILNASEANGVTTLNVNQADRVIRGMLFEDSAAIGGFTIDGSHALTLDRVGLRNESSATQTFNVDLILSESQNWEATHGGFVFNGGLDTGEGHIAVVDGPGDTTISGDISGAGGLAKDGTGSLTLDGISTNTGITFIHKGTLQVGESGLLSSESTVDFTSVDPTARLALDSRSQTIGGLNSSHGGTGHVQLGGGGLTVDSNNDLHFSGDISGEGDFIKTGIGQLILSGENSYEGDLIIENGAVRNTSANALSEHSNIRFTGASASSGTLELAGGDYALTLGGGAGEISIQGNGGFGAYGGDVHITLNEGEVLDMRSDHFRGLVLGSRNSDGTVELTNDIRLGNAYTGTTGFRSFLVDDGDAAIDGRLSGDLTEMAGRSAGFQLYKRGVLELTGNNSYTGDTRLQDGVLRLSSSGALSSHSNLDLSGGVVEFAHGRTDVQMWLGTGAGQVRFTDGGGGFSAAGADRSVTLDGGANLVWGQEHFVADGSDPLKLSSKASDATVTLTNHLSLGSGSGNRIVSVADGSADADARLSGNLTEESGATRGLTKRDEGTLELTGTNTYTGATRIEAGVLRIGSASSLPSGGNTQLVGGILEYATGGANVSADLGWGAGQVSFSSGEDGGFSVSGADRTLTLNNGANLQWGADGFRTGSGDLLLSSTGSDSTITIDNNLSLGTGDGWVSRTINVANGSAAVDARLSGNITGTANRFVKSGDGTLELTGSNETFEARIHIEGGALRLGSENAIPATKREGVDYDGEPAVFFHQNITLAGGVLELAHSDYTGYIGYARNIFFDNDAGMGGFSAVGEDRTVTILATDQESTDLVWGNREPLGANYTLRFSSPSADATLIFTNGLTMTAGGNNYRAIRVDNGSADVDARITGLIKDQNGQYGLVKTGHGTLELTNNNRYTGETHVKEGRLLIQNTQWLAQGTTYVYDGATLGGGGAIGSDVVMMSGSHMAPSNTGATRITFYQNVVFEAGSHIHLYLDGGLDVGTNYDYFNFGGTLDIEGAFLNFTFADGYTKIANAGDAYHFLRAGDGLTGMFAENTIDMVLDDQLYTFVVNYFGNQVSVRLDRISAVPEPAGFALFGQLIAVMFILRRRRARTKQC